MMNNFIFSNPTKLVFGKETIASLSRQIPAGAKVLITFGGGSVKSNGVYDQVTAALKSFDTTEFWGIEPNPQYETLCKAIAIVREKQIDFVLAVGGGSVLDGSKLIVAGSCYDGDPWDLVMNPALIKSALPLGTVLTLPATGSEMNSGAVISRKATQEKFPFHSPLVFPCFSVLDPQVTASLPKFQVACGLIDTFVHTGEQYITVAGESRLMDRWNESILQTLIEIGEKAVENPSDYDIMSDFMLSATMALNGFTAMGTTEDWATHLIGHELTALYGLTHGVTLAILYPALLDVMRADKEQKLLQYGERVWGITQGSTDERIDAAIASTRQFFESLGINTTLRGNGVGEEAIELVVGRFEERQMNLGEFGIVTPDKMRAILQKAM